ncbi:MAG: hypothetical protein NXI22_21055 [bacterium]|nr:hypothetical protein [bacterium]
MTVLKRLWNDQGGAVISIELVLVATIAVLGLIVGMTTLRNSVTNELADVAGAVDDIHQGYTYTGVQGHGSAVAGSDFLDLGDYCDDAEDQAAAADQCVSNTAVGPIDEAAQPVPGA